MASKPTVWALLIGLVPAPVNLASRVTGLVTPFSVRSPLILAVWPSTTTEVETNLAVGNFSTSSRSLLARCLVKPGDVVVEPDIGMSMTTLAADGFAGSRVRLPVISPNIP